MKARKLDSWLTHFRPRPHIHPHTEKTATPRDAVVDCVVHVTADCMRFTTSGGVKYNVDEDSNR